MLTAFEIVHSLVFVEIDPGDFHGVVSRFGLEHQESGSMPGMTGNGLKVFTRYGELQGILQFNVVSRQDNHRSC